MTEHVAHEHVAVDETFVRTREALHAVAEHVLAAARHHATGRIGLAVTLGGFGTPPFGDEPRTVAVDGTDLVVTIGHGSVNAEVKRSPLRTLADAAALAGLPAPGGPADVYRLSTPCDPDAPLALDAAAAHAIAGWYAFVDAALQVFRDEIATDEPTEPTLWPEHNDVAIQAAGINYGAAPGDDDVAVPYLYVGPPTPPTPEPDGFWNARFGAYLTWDKVHSIDTAVDFFRTGRRLALG